VKIRNECADFLIFRPDFCVISGSLRFEFKFFRRIFLNSKPMLCEKKFEFKSGKAGFCLFIRHLCILDLNCK